MEKIKEDSSEVLLLPEVHSENLNKGAREFVGGVLKEKKVDVLFIEYSGPAANPSNPYDELGIIQEHMRSSFQDDLNEYKGKELNMIKSNIEKEEYFANLENDAQPNIKDLTCVALSNGISVVAIDMRPAEIYAETGKKTMISEDAIVKRNQFMAEKIDKYFEDNPGKKGLFLCGENHFLADQGVDKFLKTPAKIDISFVSDGFKKDKEKEIVKVAAKAIGDNVQKHLSSEKKQNNSNLPNNKNKNKETEIAM
ncbi:MAG: hypothetical protein AAF673_04895 [Pseudomonadota bacterium]